MDPVVTMGYGVKISVGGKELIVSRAEAVSIASQINAMMRGENDHS
jgi:hypothetical protein